MKNAKRNLKIEEMLEGFIRTFSQYSLDGTTIQKLAAEMDMTPSLIYIYFKNKDDIIFRCTKYHHEIIQKGLVQALSKNIDNFDKVAADVLEYTDGVLEICSFLLQVMAHPKYYTAMEDSKLIVDDSTYKCTEIMLKQHGVSHTYAQGVSYLINSTINDYILKKSKERFYIQFKTIAELLQNSANKA